MIRINDCSLNWKFRSNDFVCSQTVSQCKANVLTDIRRRQQRVINLIIKQDFNPQLSFWMFSLLLRTFFYNVFVKTFCLVASIDFANKSLCGYCKTAWGAERIWLFTHFLDDKRRSEVLSTLQTESPGLCVVARQTSCNYLRHVFCKWKGEKNKLSVVLTIKGFYWRF